MTTLMFIGNYSVGKSSIINCILESFNLQERAEVGACVVTNDLQRYVANNLILIDTPGLNIMGKSIEDYASEIAKSNYIFIVVTPGTFKSIDFNNHIEYCRKIRNYNIKNIFIIMNKFDEIHEDEKLVDLIIKYFESFTEPMFCLSAKYADKYPNTDFINYIKNLTKNSGDKWLRSEIKKKIPNIIPYNKYITNIINCKWDREKWGSHEKDRELSTCSRIKYFNSEITKIFKPIKKYGKYLSNLNLELIYIISNCNIHETCIKKILNCLDCCSLTDRETTKCLIDFNFKTELDYTVIDISGIKYFVIYSNTNKIKIIDYEYIEIDTETVKNYLTQLEYN